MGAMAALPGVLMFLLAAFAASVTMGAAKIHSAEKKVRAGYRRTNLGFGQADGCKSDHAAGDDLRRVFLCLFGL